MNERPILFSGEMVRAILRGQKTQTRRPLKSPYSKEGPFEYVTTPEGFEACLDLSGDGNDVDGYQQTFVCPFGATGDRLWVKETFAWEPDFGVAYRADGGGNPEDVGGKRQKWSPSIHMPRWASRIVLEITDIRVEQVQNISEADAKAEGMTGECPIGSIPTYETGPLTYHFAQIWDSLYSARGLGWEATPWVWVVEFKRLEQPCPYAVTCSHSRMCGPEGDGK